ncbi:MAG TPA: hypothetical protein VLZ28_06895, partial [Daejeonella sp.]|nr:hypothetical protein [Daejeonella sp.]
MKRFILFVVAYMFFGHVSTAQQKVRLTDNWEFVRQDLGGIWEAVRPVGKGNPESVPLWSKV